MNDATQIHWPEHYHPRNTSVHVRNEIDIAAGPEIVWAWLIRCRRKPAWFHVALKRACISKLHVEISQIWLAGLPDNCMTGIPR